MSWFEKKNPLTGKAPVHQKAVLTHSTKEVGKNVVKPKNLILLRKVSMELNNILNDYNLLSQNKLTETKILYLATKLLNLFKKGEKSHTDTFSYVEIDRNQLQYAAYLLSTSLLSGEIKYIKIAIDSFMGINHSYPFIIDLLLINYGIDYIKDMNMEISDFTISEQKRIRDYLDDIRNRRGLDNIKYY